MEFKQILETLINEYGCSLISARTGITYYKLKLYGNQPEKFTLEEVEKIKALYSEIYV
jgi:hypothetical protein